MNIDQLRSNGHSAQGNGHLAQVQRKPKQVDYPKLLTLGRELLLAIGEDPEREGLRETPRRWADSWCEFIEYDPGTVDTCLESVSTDQMVVVSGMWGWSMCQHHCCEFGQISQSVILRQIGFSAFLSSLVSHKSMPINYSYQERLCKEIEDEIVKNGVPASD